MLNRKRMVLVGCVTLLATLAAGPATPVPADDEVRVGTFDSRALAIAYANSALFRDSLVDITKEYEKAKARGNRKVVKRIEGEMQARQGRLHLQGFSTAPVDDILAIYP